MYRRFCFDTCLQFFWIYAKKWNFRAALCVTFNSLPNAAHRGCGEGGLCSPASSPSFCKTQCLTKHSVAHRGPGGCAEVCVSGRAVEVALHCAHCLLPPCLWGSMHGKFITKMGCCLVAEIQQWICVPHASYGSWRGPFPYTAILGPPNQPGLGIFGVHLE